MFQAIIVLLIVVAILQGTMGKPIPVASPTGVGNLTSLSHKP